MSTIKNWRDEFAEKIADRINQAVAEARADEARRCATDVCQFCANSKIYDKAKRISEEDWEHRSLNGNLKVCHAYAIHERLHRESQKRGNHAKTETQAGAD